MFYPVFYVGNFQKKKFEYGLPKCLQVATTISRGDTLVLMIHRFDPVQGQSMQVIYFRSRIIVTNPVPVVNLLGKKNSLG
jgi:hypothetical protein